MKHVVPQKSKKLVLFDIDGTLVQPLRPVDAIQRFRYAIQKVFGEDIGPITEERWKKKRYNGTVDRYILWDLASQVGVKRDAFIDRIGEIGDACVEYFDSIASKGPLYGMIPDGKRLVDAVIAATHLSEGVLTGNLGQGASYKLHAAGYQDFSFGVYGHEADNREDLARLVLPKAEVYFGQQFMPSDIVIIGDTINDVECARAIGAQVVIVATGWNVEKSEFTASPPDLHVDTLVDEQLFKLLGLHT